MAKRYSGDIEVRIEVKPYVGDDGKRRLFYFASVAAPHHRGRGILSPRECGVGGLLGGEDVRSPEAYDKAAVAFIELAVKKGAGIAKHAARGDDGKIEVLRVQHAPCPTGMVGSPLFTRPRSTKRR